MELIESFEIKDIAGKNIRNVEPLCPVVLNVYKEYITLEYQVTQEQYNEETGIWEQQTFRKFWKIKKQNANSVFFYEAYGYNNKTAYEIFVDNVSILSTYNFVLAIRIYRTLEEWI
jgi:hypothetical protein